MFLLIIWLFFLTADGYSIYIKGLPLNATPAMLEDEFIRFGPIKSGGIQVRSNRVCFAFPILVILGFVILGCFSKQLICLHFSSKDFVLALWNSRLQVPCKVH